MAAVDPTDAEERESPETAPRRKRVGFRRQAIESRALRPEVGAPLAAPSRGGVKFAAGQAVASLKGLARAVPALFRLRRRARAIPYVPQGGVTDCGAACVAMVLAYHGLPVPTPDAVRTATGTSTRGVTMRGLLAAVRRFGLDGRGVRVELDGLRGLPRGSILHWGLNHFVVLDGVEGSALSVVDPAVGRRLIRFEEADTAFTGFALIVESPADVPRLLGRHRDSGWSVAWSLLRMSARQPTVWAAVVIASVAVQGLGLVVPLITKRIIDDVARSSDTRHMSALLAGGVAAAVGLTIATTMRAVSLVALQTRLDSAITTGLVKHLVDLPYGYFQSRSTGDLLMRVRSSTVIRETFTATAVATLLDASVMVTYLVILAFVDLPTALLVVALSGALVVVLCASWHSYRSLTGSALEAQAKAESTLVQLLSGIKSLKLGGAESHAVDGWSHLFVDQLNLQVRLGHLNAVTNALSAGVRLLVPVLVLTVGMYRVLDGAMSVGTLIAVNVLAAGVLVPITSLVSTATGLSNVRSYLERMRDVLTTPPERNAETGVVLHAPSGRVSMRGVTFSYQPGVPVVRNVTFDIAPGEIVAVVGPSGSGKSTIAALLAGLYVPDEGVITYDDVDLRTVHLRSLRSSVGFVPQDPTLFTGTIFENIAMTSRSPSSDVVERAARLACIHQDIVAMPMGYDTVVTEGGSSLSGGQRQRLALARALAMRPSLLVLDEATSAVDARLEREMTENLRGAGMTMIVIAHRLASVRGADRIFVVDQGVIVETGSHRELLARKGVYASLVAAHEGAVGEAGR